MTRTPFYLPLWHPYVVQTLSALRRLGVRPAGESLHPREHGVIVDLLRIGGERLCLVANALRFVDAMNVNGIWSSGVVLAKQFFKVRLSHGQELCKVG
jgi:hypothetical protein